MKISIVIPVYNCVDTIEQTLLSVLSQEFKDFELIVLDGASTDGTLDVLKKYAGNIDHLISEKDDGQYDAINKGFSIATGDVFSWINGDDIYLPGALSTVSTVFKKYEDVHWLIGLPGFLNVEGEYVRIDSKPSAFPRKFVQNGWYQSTLCGYLQQESMFWRRELWEKCKGIDLSLKLAADFDLWTRFAVESDLIQVVSPLSAFRFAPEKQRSVLFAEDYFAEVNAVCSKLQSPFWLWSWLSKRGQIVRSFLRLLVWRQTEIIIYSREVRCWLKVKCFCSVSRRSISDLLSDFFTRKFDVKS